MGRKSNYSESYKREAVTKATPARSAVPDVSQWATGLNPPPADPVVVHEG